MGIKFYIVIVFSVLFNNLLYSQQPIVYNGLAKTLNIGQNTSILEDKENKLSLDQVLLSKDFKPSGQAVPNLQISESAFWVRFSVTNTSKSNNLNVNLEYPTIDSITFFALKPDGATKIGTGEYVPYYNRQYKHQDYIFDLDIPVSETRTFLLKIYASEIIQLPMSIGPDKVIAENIFTKDLLFGLYAGIILVMLFYNFFIFLSVRDKTYLYYVLYILFVGLTQACLQGYALRLLYPDSYFLANAMQVWVPALSGIFGVYFINDFIQVRKHAPGLYKIFSLIKFLYFAIIAISLTGNYRLAISIMQVVVMALCITGMVAAVKISNKGYRPAKFFLFAFSIFIASVLIFVLRNFNILPFNAFTNYAMQIGSALEVVLLSFALADRINVFRMEKEKSQAEALTALKENERIIREQNVILESKVNDRTIELKETNKELNRTLEDLKEAEAHLVESEKMASLGQLTAGIAHEINNPINFVTSNIHPLKRDVEMLFDAVKAIEKVGMEETDAASKEKKIKDYKEEIDFDYLKIEIDHLLKGINEGASRTAEIVKGLRIFSRLDEDDLKKADMNEGLESTLIIVNNMLNGKITIQKNYGEVPLIECYPGKLNQVFLNVLNNSIYAIREKFGDKDGGQVIISTGSDDKNVYINITDNGTGMSEETQKKLFEPFFTTKDVGEGTGLGLSISWNTIKKHNGNIIVNSTPGEGSEFIFELPIVHQTLNATLIEQRG